MSLLTVRNLRTRLYLDEGAITPVDGVSLTVEAGQVVGLVGESSCGKSMTAMSILQLLPSAAEVISGEVLFEGKDLLMASDKVVNDMRGAQIGVVFQDPMTFLNPVMRIGDQIAEPLILHKSMGKAAARRVAEEILVSVGMPDPRDVAKGYPHQLSGGMRQRVLFAVAIACGPKLLIADEPFTALDVSVQDQLVQLLKEKQRQAGFSVLLITHDLSVTAELCDRIYVMYAGRIVESGEVYEIYERPKHPYTRALIESAKLHEHSVDNIISIPGSVPSFFSPPTGCKFHLRCPHVSEICRQDEPGDTRVDQHSLVRCWLHE